MARGRLARRALALLALAPAFGGVGLAAAVAHAVWFELPSGVAPQRYVSLGRQEALSGQVRGLAGVVVEEIRQRVPEAQWVTVERSNVAVSADAADLGSSYGDGTLWAEGVSGDFFSVLGVEAAHGQLAAPPDAPALVLGYDAWQRLFAGEDVAGRTITVKDEGPLPIAGVAPPRFRGLLAELAELWVLNPDRLPSRLQDQSQRFWPYIANKHVFGVLDSGTSVARLEALLADLRTHVQPPAGGQALTTTAEDRLAITPGLTGAPQVRQEVVERTGWLLAIVAGLLVLAFANLVDLLLADQNARDEERRVRVAIGATPAQLYHQCLAENAAFAAVLAMLAAGAAVYFGRLLLGVQPFARWLAEFSPAAIAVGAALGLAALLLAHAIAAGHVARMVGVASRSLAAAWQPRRPAAARRLLLLAATGSLLLVGSVGLRYWRESNLAFGFAYQQVVLMQVWSRGGAPTPGAEAIRSTVEALPQVRRTARMDLIPFIDPLSAGNRAQLVGRDELAGIEVLYGGVRAAYFETLGVPLLAGRLHQDAGEAVVSRTMARHLAGYDGEPARALGQALHLRRSSEHGDDVVATVVGIVADIPYGSYLDGERAVVYADTAGAPWDQRWAIDHDGEAGVLVAALRQAFEGLEVSHIPGPEALFEMEFMNRRGVEVLLAGAAALALVLALAGIAASQQRRLQEERRAIGIHLALGATDRDLAVRYLGALAVDFGLAAALPCAALVALGVVFPIAMAGVVAMLATELIAPTLAAIAAATSGIVWLATRFAAAAHSPAALLRAS